MSFCSTELAGRIERAECRLLEDCTAAVQGAGGEAFTRPIAGGLAAFAGAESPLTKLAGLGFGGIPEERELERIETEFGSQGASVQVELCHLADRSVGEMLVRRGYVLVGFENVLGKFLDPAELPREPEVISIERSGDADLETWLDVVVTGFASPDAQGVASHESFPREALERAIRDMASARGFLRYLARRDGEPAGGGSMRVDEGIAQLCGAATLPRHRRNGVQSALLDRRLWEAARAGCDIAVVTTLPGSKSQENVQKRGFSLLYTRAVLRRTV